MNKSIITLAVLLALGSAHAQPTQTIGNDSTGTLQNIGDIDASKASSTSTQVNPSANQNGNDLGNVVDTRTQINPNINPNTTSNALGANLALGNNSAGGAASNGQSNTGTVGNLTTGPSTSSATTGPSTATSNGTNLGINGQQQGIDRSGNSANAVTGGDQRNAQGQGQQQAATANGTNTSRQNTSAGNGAGAGAGSNNRTLTSVDAADRSTTNYSSKTTVWAPVVHGQTAAPLAAANMVIVMGSCGPLKELVAKDIVGKRFGIWGGQQDVLQGETFTAEYPVDEYKRPIRGFYQRGEVMYGERVNRAMYIIGTSTGASLSIGGFGSNGQGAQGGGSASGQLQQFGSYAWTEECEAYKLMPEVIVEQKPIQQPIIFTPAPQCEPIIQPKRKVIRRKPAPAPICK